MVPFYLESFAGNVSLSVLLQEIPWEERTEARKECMMAPAPQSYTYGTGTNARTYTAVPEHHYVSEIRSCLNDGGFAPFFPKGSPGHFHDSCFLPRYTYNVCFLNRYDDDHQHLGWHADDSITMDHDHPIAVVSFGEPREIWWKRKGESGVVPPSQRQRLAHGSLFIMPAGFQREHLHRIPRGDRAMGPRVSMTFRHYIAA